MNSLRNPYIFIRTQWISGGIHTFSLEIDEFVKESIHMGVGIGDGYGYMQGYRHG